MPILRQPASSESGTRFHRGDANSDGGVALTDAVVILERLFSGAATLPCPDAADVDDDGRLALTDAVRLLLYLFGAGEAPPPPGPDLCGDDPNIGGIQECKT